MVNIPKTVSVATAMFLSQNKNMNLHKREIKQKQKITTRTRFSVTTCITCFYLSLNKRARSLSTLRAVFVNRETPQRQIDKAQLIPEKKKDIPVDVYRRV